MVDIPVHVWYPCDPFGRGIWAYRCKVETDGRVLVEHPSTEEFTANHALPTWTRMSIRKKAWRILNPK